MPIKKIKSQTEDNTPALKAVSGAKRVEGVREIMLGLLEKGSLSRSELVKRGKFSEGALYTNLKILRDEGLIEGDEGNKKLRLTGAAPAVASVSTSEPAAVVAPAKKAAAKKAVAKKAPAVKKVAAAKKAPAPIHAGRELHDSLDSLLTRLAPMERASEKLMVLEQLARTTPKPVAEILKLLAADVARLAALKS